MASDVSNTDEYLAEFTLEFVHQDFVPVAVSTFSLTLLLMSGPPLHDPSFQRLWDRLGEVGTAHIAAWLVLVLTTAVVCRPITKRLRDVVVGERRLRQLAKRSAAENLTPEEVDTYEERAETLSDDELFAEMAELTEKINAVEPHNQAGLLLRKSRVTVEKVLGYDELFDLRRPGFEAARSARRAAERDARLCGALVATSIVAWMLLISTAVQWWSIAPAIAILALSFYPSTKGHLRTYERSLRYAIQAKRASEAQQPPPDTRH